MNDRNTGIELLRKSARQAIKAGADPRDVHRDLQLAVIAILDEFRTEFEVSGVKYWENPFVGRFTSAPWPRGGEYPPIELTRDQYLSREGIHGSYEDDRL